MKPVRVTPQECVRTALSDRDCRHANSSGFLAAGSCITDSAREIVEVSLPSMKVTVEISPHPLESALALMRVLSQSSVKKSWTIPGEHHRRSMNVFARPAQGPSLQLQKASTADCRARCSPQRTVSSASGQAASNGMSMETHLFKLSAVPGDDHVTHHLVRQ